MTISLKNSKLIASWDKITPDEGARGRMLSAVLEANSAVRQGNDEKANTKRRNTRLGLAAACLCLAAVGAIALTRSPGTPSAVSGGPSPDAARESASSQELPVISVPEYDAGSMGFEGLLYYSADELENGNPWREELQPDTLPVYKNGSFDPSGAGVPVGLSAAEMEIKLADAACALGLEVLETKYETNETKDNDGTVTPGEAVYGVRAETDGGRLTVLANGKIIYDPAGDSPLADARYTLDKALSDEDAKQVLLQLAAACSSLLDYENPEPVIQGDYSFSGEYNRTYFVYDSEDDITRNILNYSFRRARFGADDDGKLMAISVSDCLLMAEKLGDYPLISVEEAQKKLLEGHYQTSVPEAVPGEEYIARVELIYRSGPKEEILLPYYRFYVELQDMDGWKMTFDNGLRTYGAYYVPAVRDEYISGLPTYDGHFN